MYRIGLYITNPILETSILPCHVPRLIHTILEYSRHFYFYKNTVDISTQVEATIIFLDPSRSSLINSDSSIHPRVCMFNHLDDYDAQITLVSLRPSHCASHCLMFAP